MDLASAIRLRKAVADRALALGRAHPIRTTTVVLLAVSLLLVAFPAIDLAVTRMFYTPDDGFTATRHPFLIELRGLGSAAFGWVVAVAAVSLAGPLLFSGMRLLLPPRAALFLLSAAIIGPGLLVNLVFKGFWGRARPVQVTAFGGDQPFTPPWIIVDHCAWNCSFMSGEASSSIFLLGLAMIAPASWRKAIVVGVLVFAAAMSLNRIAFGGHFLSDVVISWLVTLLVLLAVHRVLYAPGSPFSDEGVAGVLGAVGDQAKAAVRTGLAQLRSFIADFR